MNAPIRSVDILTRAPAGNDRARVVLAHALGFAGANLTVGAISLAVLTLIGVLQPGSWFAPAVVLGAAAGLLLSRAGARRLDSVVRPRGRFSRNWRRKLD